MKRYTETSTIYEGMSRTFFFVESNTCEELNCFMESNVKYIVRSLKQRGIDVAGFNTVSPVVLDTDSIKSLILRQQPSIDSVSLEKRANELNTKGKSRLIFINDTTYDIDGNFEAEIISEDDFGNSIQEYASVLEKFLEAISTLQATEARISETRYRLPAHGEEPDELQVQDNNECLCNDLLAESLCGDGEIEISPIMFDKDFNISLPLYPQVVITLEPLPKTLYILFLQHPEGIVLKDIQMYETELKNIYSHVSGRKNPTVINKMFRSLTDPTENPLHKNLSIIRRCFTSKLNYNIARNYIPAHGRTKAHNIPLESEYVILPDIA